MCCVLCRTLVTGHTFFLPKLANPGKFVDSITNSNFIVVVIAVYGIDCCAAVCSM